MNGLREVQAQLVVDRLGATALITHPVGEREVAAGASLHVRNITFLAHYEDAEVAA